jgi:hypothetical protein
VSPARPARASTSRTQPASSYQRRRGLPSRIDDGGATPASHPSRRLLAGLSPELVGLLRLSGVSTENDRLFALARGDGRLLWSIAATCPDVVGSGDRAVALCTRGKRYFPGIDTEPVQLDLRTGARGWRIPARGRTSRSPMTCWRPSR